MSNVGTDFSIHRPTFLPAKTNPLGLSITLRQFLTFFFHCLRQWHQLGRPFIGFWPLSTRPADTMSSFCVRFGWRLKSGLKEHMGYLEGVCRESRKSCLRNHRIHHHKSSLLTSVSALEEMDQKSFTLGPQDTYRNHLLLSFILAPPASSSIGYNPPIQPHTCCSGTGAA